MNDHEQKLSSSSTFKMLGALWLRDKLNCLEHKLDILLSVSVSPEQLVKLTQTIDESKNKSDVLAQTIQENK
jgi:glycine cleavage system regulatory protein